MGKLFLGAACIGFAPIFVRLMTLEPTPIALYRCGFAALFLFTYLAFTSWPKFFRWPRKVWGLLFLAGGLFALDLFIWHRSVIYAGAGIGTILGNTQVFYVALVGIFIHKEKPTFRFLGSVLTAFFGIYLLVSYQVTSEVSPHYALGVVFGLLTGVIYASYILTMRKMESLSKEIPTEQALACISLIASLLLIPVSLMEGSLRLPIGNEWILLISLAFVAQVLGWLLITRTLPKTPVSQAGLILNMQPVVAVLAGALILHEKLSPLQLTGAVLTLFAIYLGTQRKLKPARSLPQLDV